MRGFTATGANATGTATKTALTIIAATTVRPALMSLVIGNKETPADQYCQMQVRRFTAAGTAGSTPTPAPVDPSDVAALATCGAGHSVEPTYSGVLLDIPMNQRCTFQWMAAPGYELKAPATAAKGLGIQLLAAGATMIMNTTGVWFE